MNPSAGKGSGRLHARQQVSDKQMQDNWDKAFPKKAEPELYCPQCGEDTDRLHEGYCEPCCEQNQKELDEHNASFDRWQGLSDEQRDLEIKLSS